MRACCTRTSRADFLCRVLTPGILPDGCNLAIVERPHPQWTLFRVSSLIYGMERGVQQASVLRAARLRSPDSAAAYVAQGADVRLCCPIVLRLAGACRHERAHVRSVKGQGAGYVGCGRPANRLGSVVLH